ncbi:MAG: acyl-CoA thioesterase [Phycisphaerae bacterium]|nr:acyl-CoA thioesterase [Phycisphaerae bacterium]
MPPVLNANMADAYLYHRAVQFSDTDMAGVLHFSNYYRYMEEAEHAFWRSLGESVVVKNGDHAVSWPRVATGCEYFAPARFEDVLDLALTVSHVGNRSVSYEIEFRRGGERIAIGRTTAVCCTMSGGNFGPTEIPPSLREKLVSAAGVPEDSPPPATESLTGPSQ